MKIKLLVVWLLIFMLSGFCYALSGERNISSPFQIISESDELIVVDFELGDFTLDKQLTAGLEYHFIDIAGASFLLSEGKPEIPAFTVMLAIPFTGSIVLETDQETIGSLSDILLRPCQPPVPEIGQISDTFVKDQSYYNSDSTYPESFYLLGDPAVIRDLRVVTLRISPFQFNPQSRELAVLQKARLKLKVTREEGENEKYILRKPSRSFSSLYNSLTSNNSRYLRTDEYQQPCYLFIYPQDNQVVQSLQPLLDWKADKGFEVHAVSTTVTGTSLTAIRNYIQNAYDYWENPPEFVCLVGDAGGSFNIPTGHMDGGSYNGEGDHYYTTLEGDDYLSDIFIGRLSFNTIFELQTVIAKIINYEKYPYTDNPDWFDRALLVGDPSSSGPSTVDTKMNVAEMINWHSPNMECIEVYDGNWVNQIAANLNNGVAYFNYRGFAGVSGWTNSHVNNLNNGYMLPVAVVLTCVTGDFEGTSDCLSERFLKAGTPTLPKGAVAAISTATGNTHTCFNNCIDAGIFHGLFADSLYNMGAALVRGKLNLHLNYPDNPNNSVVKFSYWNNLMGDPGLELWTGIPQTLHVYYPSTVGLGTSQLQVEVTDSSGNPLADAWVAVRNESNEISAQGMTDAAGTIILPISCQNPGEVSLVVTRHNFLPHLGNFEMQIEPACLSLAEYLLDDDQTGSSNGNNDGLINPGETIELGIALRNTGTQPVDDVYASLSCISPGVNIITSQQAYGTLEAGETVFSPLAFCLEVDDALPGGTSLEFRLQIYGNSEAWNDRFFLPVYGPHLIVQHYSVWDDDDFILDPGETADLEIVLENIGHGTAIDITAELISDDTRLEIISSFSNFGSIPAGGAVSNQNNRFELYASTQIINGTQIPVLLTVTSSDGLQQSLNFLLEIGQVSQTDPLGPDQYGYYCYDDGDVSYFNAPVYQWIEIDPAQGGNGIILPLSDNGDMGDCETIPLPIPLIFYGLEYNSATISSNGWISPGETDLQDFMNWSIPGPGGPSPMIAAFWDDLKTTNGNVCYYFNSALQLFIVEWSNLLNQYNNQEETFQVIIKDPYAYPTSTGDNEILVQYKTVHNVDQGQYNGFYVEHGQYATVGLEDHTGLRGLQYTFNNQYPTAAKPLQDEMAILFTGPPVNQEEPFLVLGGYQLLDDNGILEYAETAPLIVSLNNLGNNPATGVNTQISTNDPYLSILQDASPYADIPGGMLVDNSIPFTLAAAANTPDGHIAVLDLAIFTDQGSWNLHLSLILHAPQIEFVNLFINDGDNGVLDPGETADILLSYRNAGGAAVHNSVIDISSLDELLIVNSAQFDCGDFPAQYNETAIFNVSASPEASIGHYCPLLWQISGDHEFNITGSVPIVISQIPVYLEEHFSTFPPTGWQITGGTNWTQGSWSQAGGMAPEAQFNWYPESIGDQRLITMPLNTLGSSQLELEFKHAISHFSGTYNLYVQTSSDGQTWHDVASYPPQNLSSTTENLIVETPDVGSQTFRLAFTFSGNSYNINNWFVDDVYLNSSESLPFGYLSGRVSLQGGNGLITDLQVTAGNFITNPNAAGDYILPLPVGSYEVHFQLTGYEQIIAESIEISEVQTTILNVDLSYLSPPGMLSAEVMENDVTLTWQMPLSAINEITSGKLNSDMQPEANNHATANGTRVLNGFRIYRNDTMICELNDPAASEYSDNNLLNGEYLYYVTALYENGESEASNVITINIDYNDSPDDEIVLQTQLFANSPNPFNPSTTITFSLAAGVTQAVLNIYNIKGQIVRSYILNPSPQQIMSSVTWDGRDETNHRVASGIFFYELKTADYQCIRKMLLLK